jgi:uncharacterized protein (TIGR00369 family)
MPEPSLTEQTYAAMPFARVLGIDTVVATAAEVVMTGEWAHERCTAGALLHGGYLMALVDNAGGLCAFLNLPDDAAGTATIESKTNFFRGVRSGTVRATAVPIHVGRSTIVVQTDVTDESGELVTRSLQTQSVLRPH